MAHGQSGVFEISIQSSYDMLDRVSGLVEAAAQQVGISEDDEVDLMISVMEAVNNAIQHGNREDATKKVHIRIQTAPARMLISIKDEGRGFNPSAVPDPREEENLMRASGRGILMMQAFMDVVEFSAWEHGNEVRMIKAFKLS